MTGHNFIIDRSSFSREYTVERTQNGYAFGCSTTASIFDRRPTIPWIFVHCTSTAVIMVLCNGYLGTRGADELQSKAMYEQTMYG